MSTDKSYSIINNGEKKKFQIEYEHPYLIFKTLNDDTEPTLLYYERFEKKKQLKKTKKKLKEKLQGQWNYLNCEEVNRFPFIKDKDVLQENTTYLSLDDYMSEDYASDEVFWPCDKMPSFDLIFEKDSPFEINTNIELTGKGIYFAEGNYINLFGDILPFYCHHDTLEIYHRAEKNEYLKVTYLKSEIDQKTFSALKKYKFNYHLLLGEWVLKGGLFYPNNFLDFPHEISNYINVTKENFIDSNHTISVKTDGQAKKYRINYYEDYLTLYPDGWYSDYSPLIYYERSSISNKHVKKAQESIKSKLQGQWNIIHSEYSYPVTPEIIFKDDSVFYLNPPMELYGGGTYNVIRNHFRSDERAQPFRYHNDTLDIYQMGEKDYQKVTYLKFEIDHSLLSFLKKHKINYPLLAGDWALLREDEGVNWRYKLEFPHEIADTITVTNEDLLSVMQDKNYFMLTDDTLKKYELGYESENLTLKPGDWYKGEDPEIRYTKLPPKPQNIPKFQGHWKLYKTQEITDIPFIKSEWLIERNVESYNILGKDVFIADYIFESDSAFEVDVPMEIINKGTYYTAGNYLTMHGITFLYDYYNDTISLYFVCDRNKYLKATYIITKINQPWWSNLKKYRVNYPLLAGKWILDRDYYSWQFPYEVADTIMITKEEIISTRDRDKSYLMYTDGKKKKYKYGYKNMDFVFFEEYTEDDRRMNPNITFETEEVYNSYLRSINDPYLTLQALDWGDDHITTLRYKKLKE